MAKFNVDVPDDFLEKFDKISKDAGYKTRVEAVRAAMRKLLEDLEAKNANP